MHESLTIALLQARETAMGFFRPILKSHNLTEQQWRIIRVLANSRSIEFHELAAETCILRPSLTGILSRMERDKLIFRLKPVNDQRKLYVSLTSRARICMKWRATRWNRATPRLKPLSRGRKWTS